jgi:uncharacterized protein (DUF1697 family)
MPHYVAFLRAINIGGRVVKMDRLRALFEEMGHSDVKTFIASGNVVFQSRSRSTAVLEKQIEKNLKRALGYEVATFVRSADEVVAIVDHAPFVESELSDPDHNLYVALLREAPAHECAKAMLKRRSDFDDFHINGREVYWLCRGRFSDSSTSSNELERTLRCAATVRNSNTLRKLASLHFRKG